ncbi:MAG: 50S ribosomal protein L3 N(5)-glutamine methyltransferase [Methylococcales bacterium]|nr:50S ribosomal protein L3 N(5)-glutamine methyltransferase [Methylococcales bacterium]
MSTNPVVIDADISMTLKTIRDYMRWGASLFTEHKVFLGHGIATPLHESATIVLHTLFQPYQLDDCYLDAVLTFTERERVIKQLIRRVAERKPAAYITNEALFAGLCFYVDERVLVPRSPVAELIEQSFEPWVDAEQVTHILDLCTGSACIAIACAYAFPQAQVDAVELSDDAVDVANINIEKHDIAEQVTLYQSDLFKQLPETKYDLIVSNPPYVAIQEWKELPAEYHNEPEMGFTGGETGLDLVLRILVGANNYLTEQGILIVEVGSSAETLQQLFPEIPFYWLEFERGGDGVFLLTAEQLKQYHKLFCNYSASP